MLNDAPPGAGEFFSAGVKPSLVALKDRAVGTPLAALFAEALQAFTAALPEPPDGWVALTPAQAITLLAACRYRTLAYGDIAGEPAEHLAAARKLVTSLAAQRAWANSTLLDCVDPATLALPTGGSGYGWNFLLTGATFEQVIVVEGERDTLLVIWTDED